MEQFTFPGFFFFVHNILKKIWSDAIVKKQPDLLQS